MGRLEGAAVGKKGLLMSSMETGFGAERPPRCSVETDCGKRLLNPTRGKRSGIQELVDGITPPLARIKAEINPYSSPVSDPRSSFSG